MSGIEKTNDEIITLILKHPDGKKTRETALKINNIGFNAGLANLMPKIFDEKNEINELKELLNTFRTQIQNLLSLDLQQNNEELRMQIIYPLIKQLLTKTL